MTEEVRAVRERKRLISPAFRAIQWVTPSTMAAVACIILAFASGAAFQEREIDHDIVLRNHKLLIQDDDGNERVRLQIDKIELKDPDGHTRIKIAIEDPGRAGIHFYNRAGLKRIWIGSGNPPDEVPWIYFFDPTGQTIARQISPAGIQ